MNTRIISLTPLTCLALARDGAGHDSRAGRLAAKRAAAALAGLPALTRIEIQSRLGQAPEVFWREASGHRRPLPLALSLTHRHGRAAAAVATRSLGIGVDLERRGAVAPEQARYFLAPGERRLAAHLDATLLWTLKEAAWKALGLGAAVPFQALELVLDGERRLCALAIHAAPQPARARLFTPWPGFVLAVVLTRRAAR